MTNKGEQKRLGFILDTILLGILVLFMLFSLLAIYKSGEHLGYSSKGFVMKQAMWYVIGFGVVFVLIRLGSEFIQKMMRILYFVLLGMLFLLIVVKYVRPLQGPLRFLIEEVKGAWAWYKIPGLGTFQPSEFMKIALLFICADVIDHHNKTFLQSSFVNDLRLFFKIGLWVLPPLILNFLQPDTGIPIIVVISLIFMLYVGGTKNYWFIWILVVLVALYFGIMFLYFNYPEILSNIMGGSGSNSYRLRRFYGWLEYEKYSQTWGYQLYNSLISMGMGGLSGISNSTFIVHLAEAQNDFIFAVIGSQFGLFGAIAVIVLCLALNFRLVYIAMTSIEAKSKYIIAGLMGIFMYQQLQNIGMMVGILPITGITLPLISYGGSSLISYMIGLSYPFLVYSHTKNNPVYETSKLPIKISE